ncbi:MAG: primosomal protein N' [Thermoleophilia bacterium]|nr:primosomal protein N' [Thermoleophilia bacterium]
MHLLVRARSIDRAFDYLVPEALRDEVGPGSLVACPLGPRRVMGVVVGVGAPTHEGRLVALSGVVAIPPVRPELMRLAGWIARHDLAPLEACLRLVLPPGADGAIRKRGDGTWQMAALPGGERRQRMLRIGPTPEVATSRQRAIIQVLAEHGALPPARLRELAGTTAATLNRMVAAGALSLSEERVGVSIPVPAGMADEAPDLTVEQGAAVARIGEISAAGGGSVLLHGVTGSGKTEVYLRAITEARSQGRSAIMLVPEISLTPQTLARVGRRLGAGVEVWHSAMSPAERGAAYQRLRRGQSDVVIGARSAIFAPLADLGVVIVDEEHDGSYKQDASPRYDARQIAFLRARDAGAVAIFGSATPRPETWRALERITLTTRVDGSLPPRVQVVDMRTQGGGPISAPLARALRDAKDRGEKAVLLLNRRGFALMALCRECGWIATCPNCDTSLVHHLDPARLVCHHCGFEMPPPRVCQSCGAADLMRGGHGTEGLERALERVVPGMRRVRMDAGSAAGRGAVDRLLEEFAAPGAAVLLGTQMVAKGHDLPDVTVAAVLDADAGLRYPDFRAEERTFSLIVQATGRAGRRGEPATVVVQAFEPDARAVRLAADLAVEPFLDEELERRQAMGMPPFGALVRIVVEGGTREPIERAAEALAETIRQANPELRLLGPAPLHRLRGRHRRALLIRADRSSAAAAAAAHAIKHHRGTFDRVEARVTVDVDPQAT